MPKYRSFKLQKKIEVDKSHIPPGRQIMGESLGFLGRNWRLFGKITLVYLVIYLAFIRVASGLSLGETRDLIDTFYPGTNALLIDTTLAGLVLSSSVTVGGLNFVVGLFLALFTSLAYIRAIRLTSNDEKTTLRDAYYNGMQPLIPFLLLVLLLLVQLMPFVAGGLLFLSISLSGLVVGIMEQALFIIIWIALAVLSAYWVTNTVMSLYASTIPDMYPLVAHRATGELVHLKRLVIFKRLLFLGVFLTLLSIAVVLLAVMVADGIAFYARDLTVVLGLPITHVYLYKLYRSIL